MFKDHIELRDYEIHDGQVSSVCNRPAGLSQLTNVMGILWVEFGNVLEALTRRKLKCGTDRLGIWWEWYGGRSGV